MAEVVYTGVTDAGGIRGQLFQGQTFWLSLKANGGQITPLEKQADVKIVDHKRKEQLPGTYSYQYIEKSLRNGVLEDLDKYAVGSPTGTTRTVGSTVQPAKSGRTKFTPEDDRILVKWVVGMERSGSKVMGNEIYKQLEAEVRKAKHIDEGDTHLRFGHLESPTHLAVMERSLVEESEVSSKT
ncbi:MAG: hypothetical protein Q9220_000599 [cf. Caloplaca sp. 1 TL-2023]